MLENQLHWMVVTNFPNDGILLIVFITKLPWQYSLNIQTIFPICTQPQPSTCCTGISDTQQLIDLIDTSNCSCISVCENKVEYISILGPKVVHVVVPLSCYNVGTWMKLSPLKLSDCWKPSLSSCQHLSE